jgi:inner membrane protein
MDNIVFWHWWALGFALLIAEVLLPSTFCLWLGIAAFVTGAVVWLLPALGGASAVSLFAVLAVAAVGAWFRFRPRAGNVPDNGLNQRGRQYVGQTLVLVEPIVEGFGKARVEDTVWRVAGPDLPAGQRVRVVAVDGATLHVIAVASE